MQRRLPLLLATAMLLFTVGCSETSTPTAIENTPSAASGEGNNLTDLIESGAYEVNTVPASNKNQKSDIMSISSAMIYTDREEWENALPNTFYLATEDFENSLDDGFVAVCPGPVEQRTGGNGCYPPRREILKIVNLDDDGTEGVAALVPNDLLGNSSTIIGPNNLLENMILTFDELGLKTVGFDISETFGFPSSWNIEVYGSSGLLASFVATSGFYGIYTDADIEMIKILDNGLPSFQVIDNLTFNHERPH